MSGGLQVGEERASELTAEWAELWRASGCAPVFASPWWQELWWRAFEPDAQPCTVAIRDAGGRLTGVAPLMRRDGALWLAGDHEVMDYMDVVCLPEDRPAVLSAVAEALAAEGAREVRLWGLSGRASTAQALAEPAERAGWSYERGDEAVCPTIELPGSWDEYLARLGKHDRHELRRKLRRFAELGDEPRVVPLSQPDEVAAAMSAFIRLATESRHDKAHFMTARMERFFRAMAPAMAEAGVLRLYQLHLDERPVGSLIAFRVGEELQLYNSGYDPALAGYSVGLVHKAMVLRHAIDEGLARYDLLRGNERYKYDLGARDNPVYTVMLRREAG